jgi:transposase
MTSVSVGFEAGGELGKRTRRRWSPEEKLRLVALTHQPNASIAGVARDHGLNANLLFNWRRKFDRNGLVVAPPAELTFAQIDVVAAPVGVADAVATSLMRIDLPGGARIRVDAQVDELALRRVLAALKAVA